MAERRCLVVYYSRTGTTRQVAERIAELLDADLGEVTDLKDRSGAWGFVVGGKDARFKKPTEIGEPAQAPADYDLVAIGTPVWAWTVTPAIRTYLTRHREELPEVAFFLTTGGTGMESTFETLEELCGKPPRAMLGLRQKDVLKGDPEAETAAFVDVLKS
jgi:flavodoxin